MRSNRQGLWRVGAIVVFVFLGGCHGGGGDDDDEDDVDPPANPADAAGLWGGTATVAGSTVPYIFAALVTSDGHARIGLQSTDPAVTLPPTIVEGDLRDVAGTLTMVGGKLYTFALPHIGDVTGEFDGTPRVGMTGAMTFSGKTYNLTGTYNPQYERASSLATIAGVYTRTNGTFTITVAIDSNGALTGSDSRNCTIIGTVQADRPTVNAYSFGWNATGCTGVGFNGFFSGRMALVDSFSSPGMKQLALFAHSDTFSMPAYAPERP